MSKSEPPKEVARARKLNRRALLALVVLPLLLIVGGYLLKSYQNRRNNSALLAEARKQAELKQVDLAVSYLNSYLASNPDSSEALELKAQILADNARGDADLANAITVYTTILARETATPAGQAIRRKLIDLNLRITPTRVRAAEALARDLIKNGADDPEAHRQLARTLEIVAKYLGGEDVIKTLDEAIKEYEKAEQKQPGDVATAERLAYLYRSRFDDKARALEILDKALEFNRSVPEKLAAARMARCRHFMDAGDKERAVQEVEAAVEIVPGDLEARLVLAELAAQSGDTVAARAHIQAIDPEKRKDLRIKLVSGLIELNEQKLDEAVQSWRSGLLQVGGRDEQLTWRLAQVLLQLNRISEATPLIEQYRRLVGKDEPTPEYRYLKALASLKQNRTAEAIQELEAIRYRIDKNLSAQLLFVLGQAYEAVRDTGKALETYRQAAAVSKGWNGPWLAIARLQLADGVDTAAADLERGLQSMPDDPNLLASLAQIQWRKQVSLPEDRRDWSAVESVLERGKLVAPNSAELAMVRADYLNATRRPEDALAVLQGAVKQNPNSVGLWLANINLLSRLGRFEQALESVARATASAGDQAVFRTTHAYLLMSRNRTKQARTVLTDGLDKVLPEQRPVLWKALTEFYMGQNDPVNARKACAEWARIQPDNPEPRMNLLDLALAADDREAARAEVDAMENLGGKRNIYWRLARVQELLHDSPKADADGSNLSDRLEEADRLVKTIKAENPRLALGHLLEARLMEKRGRIDDAIRAYEQALELKAGPVALRPLVVLLTREKRDADLERLRRREVLSTDMQKLSAELTLKMGETDRAEQMIEQLVQGNPQSLDLRAWQAKLLNTMGRGEAAEESIQFLIRQKPDEPGPWLQLLMLQVARKQIDAANATVEQIRARVKTDNPELLWALCYRVVGNGKKADEAFQAALQRSPDEQRVLLAAISFYESSGRLVEAEKALRHLLKLDPTMGWANRKLALILADKPKDAGAWKEAITLVGENGSAADTPEDRIVRAVVYARGPRPEDRQQGIRLLQELLADDPTNTGAHFQLARMMLREKQPAKAREHAAKAAEAEDAGTEAILLYAGLLLANKEFDAAQELLGRLERLAPGSLPTVELAARIKAGRGRMADAVAELEAAYDAYATTPEATVVGQGLMRILVELNQPEAAERVGRKVAEASPQGACLLAELLITRNRPDEAAEWLAKAAKAGGNREAGRTALALAARDADARWLAQADEFLALALKGEPDSIEVLQAVAYLRHLQRRHGDEVDLYNKILDSKPSDYLFLNNMAWTLSENLGKPEEGLKRATEALEKVGFDPHIADTRGVILTRLGRYDEAIRDLEAAANVLPTPAVLYHLARAHHKAGHKADFEKYRELARQAGLNAKALSPGEVEEMEALMKL